MKRSTILLILFLSLLSQGCGLSIKTARTVYYPPSTSKVTIYNANQILPDGLERIGSITINDSGFTSTSNGTYEACITALENEARKMGGDVINIVNIQAPNDYSTIYRMAADVYRKKQTIEQEKTIK